MPHAYVFSIDNTKFHCFIPWINSICPYSARTYMSVFFSLKLASGTSAEGHNVGKINWHISAMKIFNSMSRKFPACLCSVLSTDLTADRLREGSVKNAPITERSFNFAIFINNTHGCDKYSTKLRTEPHCFCQHSCEMSTRLLRLLGWHRYFVPDASVIVILYEIIV